jgi:hypothetical protein
MRVGPLEFPCLHCFFFGRYKVFLGDTRFFLGDTSFFFGRYNVFFGDTRFFGEIQGMYLHITMFFPFLCAFHYYISYLLNQKLIRND